MTIHWKAVEQNFTVFVFQFYPVCNFGKFGNFGSEVKGLIALTQPKTKTRFYENIKSSYVNMTKLLTMLWRKLIENPLIFIAIEDRRHYTRSPSSLDYISACAPADRCTYSPTGTFISRKPSSPLGLWQTLR